MSGFIPNNTQSYLGVTMFQTIHSCLAKSVYALNSAWLFT